MRDEADETVCLLSPETTRACYTALECPSMLHRSLRHRYELPESFQAITSYFGLRHHHSGANAKSDPYVAALLQVPRLGTLLEHTLTYKRWKPLGSGMLGITCFKQSGFNRPRSDQSVDHFNLSSQYPTEFTGIRQVFAAGAS